MRILLSWAVSVTLAGLATLGCGEGAPSDDSAAGAGGTASGGDASGSGGGGAASSGGASTGGGATAAGPDFDATVLALPFGRETFLLVTAALRSGGEESDVCEVFTEGNCTVRSCPVEGRPEPAVGPRVDAGTVTATFDTGEGLTAATVEYGTEGYPGAASFLPTWFVAGRETGTISALGGSDVDAFEREFTVPLMLVLTNPAMGDTPARTIQVPKAGLELEWERGETGVELYIESLQTPDDGTTTNFLQCTFDSSQGRGSIPATLAARMRTGGTALLLTGRRTSFVQNDREVRLRLYTGTLVPERDAALSLVFVD